MLAVWKGVITPGQSWNDLVDVSDILPTLTDLLDGVLPADAKLDGHSFADLLSGEGHSTREWAYAEHRGRFFVKTQKRKLYSTGEFYNTEADPFEKSPLDTAKLSKEATADWKLLRQAIETIR